MRIVFFSDTHLGLDMPARPRVEKRRRGEDFFANVERVLAFAAARVNRVDLVLHGGDLFFRSRVPPFIVDRVYARLVRFVEETGIPLGVIAGNHERSALPVSLLLSHPLLHVFARASTHVFRTASGARIAVTGVPFTGDGRRFCALAADATHAERCDARLLLAHEAFEGAVCGPSDFTFRPSRERADVVPLAGIPDRFDMTLSGHIHRRQVLWRSRTSSHSGVTGRAPIVYAGSVERTSFAEMSEQKTFAVVTFDTSVITGEGVHGSMRFVALPARPMFDVAGDDADALAGALAALPHDALVRITCTDQGAIARAHQVQMAVAPAIDVELRGPSTMMARRG
jgi:exonuclease SbcD